VRVLLVNDLAPGPGSGAEVYVDRLAQGLEAAGDTVELFAGEVEHRGARRLLDLWDPFARRQLEERAARFRPDVVHCHNVLNELSAAVLGVPADVASVLTVHDSRIAGAFIEGRTSPAEAIRGVKNRVARAVARRRVDLVVAVSQELATRLTGVGFPRVRVVPVFAPAPRGEPPALGDDVVFAGQLISAKGVHVLVDAFARIADRHPGSRLRLAGDGPQRTELDDLAQRLAPGRIELPGLLDADDVRSLVAGARVVCDPALTVDGSRTLIVEAQLMGRPVVASDRPGPRELLGDGDAGLIVPGGDAAALAAALDRLLTDRDLAVRLGDAGRRRAQENTLEHGVAAMHAIYAEAIARHRP
jgi:glycosyltransferase involved in cell wall biosynthesis